jgi:hypothetical protein
MYFIQSFQKEEKNNPKQRKKKKLSTYGEKGTVSLLAYNTSNLSNIAAERTT